MGHLPRNSKIADINIIVIIIVLNVNELNTNYLTRFKRTINIWCLKKTFFNVKIKHVKSKKMEIFNSIHEDLLQKLPFNCKQCETQLKYMKNCFKTFYCTQYRQ